MAGVLAPALPVRACNLSPDKKYLPFCLKICGGPVYGTAIKNFLSGTVFIWPTKMMFLKILKKLRIARRN